MPLRPIFVRLFIIFFGVTCPLFSVAQNAKKIRFVDSLKKELSGAKEDTARLYLLMAIAKETNNNLIDCDDTGKKAGYIRELLYLAKKTEKREYLANALLYYGDMYDICVKDYDNAIFWYDSTYKLAKFWGFGNLEYLALVSIAGEYAYKTKYDMAVGYYKKSLETEPNNNDKLSVLGNMGNIYTKIGDYPRAADCYEQSYKILNQKLLTEHNNTRNDTLTAMYLLWTIADVDVLMSQYDKALKNYAAIKAINSATKEKTIDRLVLMGLGNCYYHQKEYLQAISNNEAALLMCREQKDEENEIILLNQLGNCYYEIGDNEKAMRYAQQALTKNSKDYFVQHLPDSYLLLGKVAAKNKDYRHGMENMQKAISLYQSSARLDDESKAWAVLSGTYSDMGNTAAAFDAYKRHIALRDSVYSQDKARQITSIEMQGEFDRQKDKDSLAQAKKDVYTKLKMQQQKVVSYSGFAGLLVVLVLSFFIYRNYSQQKKANVLISRANEKIKDEKQMSEALLLNILPENVAKELKEHGDVQPKQFDNVTVMFTDFVDFTIASDKLTPQQLVAELHECFMAFDIIISKYNVEKIKTVGDAYIAVSGLPQPNEDHATEIVKAALEIRDFMLERRRQLPEDTFDIRIGVNSGPVIAGIVGVKKFAYDIWGDTVNVAARMEQNCEVGKVNISEKTYQLVKGKFTTTDRGVHAIKNKGEMRMYYIG